MAAGAGCGESVDQYRAEVERLAQELAEANREKIRAAECGLAVLEENQALKQKYTELETEQEILRKELEQLQEVRGEDGAVILFIYLFSFCREGKALQSGVWLACTSIEWRSAGIYKPVWRPEAEWGRQFIRAFKKSNSLMQLKYDAIEDAPAGKCATLYE